MCGIAGIISLKERLSFERMRSELNSMSFLLRHRGPDGKGTWVHTGKICGLTHRRLSIIDIETGGQPMTSPAANTITYNGELYNYIELKSELSGQQEFTTRSDTEVLLRCYEKWGPRCLEKFKGMFAFAIWDESSNQLFCARDRFGIKPFYYTQIKDVFYFASEAKALLPFLPSIETDRKAFREYLTFQFCLNSNTLFKGIKELPPGHTLTVKNGKVKIEKYWEPLFRPDFNHTQSYFTNELRSLLKESVRIHLRSDVPMGAYVSGGLDSGTIASLAKEHATGNLLGFTGKFKAYGKKFDESAYARSLCIFRNIPLHEIDITAQDFIDNIQTIIYALDYPVAGPGAFSQFMVSKLAARHRKVVLGGQGGDEIFGGYTRYLIAYFEQCIKAAIDGTMNDGNFIVTYESIIPNLVALQSYKPLMRQFWKSGLFGPMDKRYFALINRCPGSNDEIRWKNINNYDPYDAFKTIFNAGNVDKKASYFDSMTNFDLRTLLPALLHVEDRMSMVHGLESRVPLLDHELVEKACSAPSNIKFKNGTMKYLFKEVIQPFLPADILERTDKMGFPTPLNQWLKGEAKDFIMDTLGSSAARSRELIDNEKVLKKIEQEPVFGRKLWGFLSLEIWQQAYHDKQHILRKGHDYE